MTKILIPAVMALSLVACGGGGGDDDGDDSADPDAAVTPDGTPIDPDAAVNLLDQLFEDLVSIICGKAFECEGTFPGTPAEHAEQFGASEAACIDMYTALIAGEVAGYQASVDAGRMVFDNEDGQTCLATQDALTCDVYWGADGAPECDTTFVGQVADGDACTMGEDCAGANSYCDETTDVCTP